MKLKFLGINIWQGGYLMDELLPFLKETDADIIAMQEVYAGEDPELPRHYRSLEIFKALGYPHTEFEKAFVDNREVGKVLQGNAIYSKFPITSSRAVFFDIPFGERPEHVPEYFLTTPRNVQHAVINFHGTDLNVFNTQGIWGTHGSDTDRRIEMAKTLVREIEGKDHVILTGDFNFNPGTKAMGLVDEKLTDIFKGELVSTYNTRQKENPVFAEVICDMLFISDDIRVLEKSCPNINVSDHLPLIATFEI